MHRGTQTAHEAARITSQLREESPTLLRTLDVDALARELLHPRLGEYHRMPPRALLFFSWMEKEHGSRACSLAYRLLLVRLIQERDGGVLRQPVPPSVGKLQHEWFDRVLADLQSQPDEFYSRSNDLYLKDLAVCRGHMFPACPQVVETSRLGKRFLFTQGLFQGIRATRACLADLLWRDRPYYQIHVDDRYLSFFHAQGWYLCYLRIAQMLKLHPGVCGVIGSSWILDPGLKPISPHLAYQWERPRENGASFFRLTPTKMDYVYATRSSRHRRQYAERGEYVPTPYLMLWRRRDVLRWADAQFASGGVNPEDLLRLQ
jgi:hypothetical protein